MLTEDTPRLTAEELAKMLRIPKDCIVDES